MKKATLFSSIVMLGFSAFGQITAPEVSWYELLEGVPGADQATAIATDGINAVYSAYTLGSNDDNRDIKFGDTYLFDGAQYTAPTPSNGNKNFTLIKTDAEGKYLWNIHTTWGDAAANAGSVVVNNQGDVIFSGIIRHTDGHLDEGIIFVDAKGKEIKVDGNIERRYQRLFWGCASADGEIRWIKLNDMDTAPVPDASGNYASFTADALNTYGLTVDDQCNIYVSGNFRAAMTFTKADGAKVTLNPKNVEGWNGDPQGVVGDLFLVKFNKDGDYLTSLTQGGDNITASYMQNIEWVDGSLYVYGYLKGKAGAVPTLCGIALDPTVNVSPFIAKLDADLTADWAVCLKGETVQSRIALQNVGMTVADGKIWIAGQFNGKFVNSTNSDEYVESITGTMREGLIIKLDTADGAWLGATNSKADFTQNVLTGYFKIILAPEAPSKIYAYGYGMNASVGVFLREYDAETLKANLDHNWSLITQGGAPTCQSIAFVPELPAIYVTARGNRAFKLGDETTAAITGYQNIFARFDMPQEFYTGVESAIADEDSDAEAVYYNLQGIQVTNPSNGIYIVKRGQKVTKELIR